MAPSAKLLSMKNLSSLLELQVQPLCHQASKGTIGPG